jgi:uncharacterized protein (DUF1697 family)
MEPFAFLDDSLVKNKEYYVYSHALVFDEEDIETIVFTGNNKEIYSNEKQIISFLENNLTIDTNLILCRHYSQYSNFNKIKNRIYYQFVDEEIFDLKKKYFKKMFTLAHHSAKKVAKDYVL